MQQQGSRKGKERVVSVKRRCEMYLRMVIVPYVQKNRSAAHSSSSFGLEYDEGCVFYSL